MTISSSLNAGVAGLAAHANRLATIADNIANSSTYGYKRAETDFHSVVFNRAGSANYTAGGVRTTSMRLIDDRGPLISTSNPTDIAIDGRGFFPVTSLTAAQSGQAGTFPLMLMTTGSFRPDNEGILRSALGHVLMGWPAATDGNIGNPPRDTAVGLEPVRIYENQYVSNPTLSMKLGINLPAAESRATGTGAPINYTMEYFTNLGGSEDLTFTFTPTVPVAGASNQWTMAVVDSATGAAPIAEYTLAFNDTQTAGGTLASVTQISGAPYDPATGTLPLTVAGGAISVEIGQFGLPSGMTQIDSPFAPVSVSKDGSGVATLTGVEVDPQGFLNAIYDQGFSRRIYQIPVIDVANANGLVTLAEQTYGITQASGTPYLWDSGTGPTGSLQGFAREESATDVAGELTQLIQTQRAYSSNAKVIQTVDEMLQETTNLKR